MGISMPQAAFVSEGKHLCFAMFHINEARTSLLRLQQRELQPRDFAVLYALMSYCDYTTGKIRFTVDGISSEIGFNKTAFINSMQRLKKARLATLVIDKDGDRYHLLNPYLFSTGGRNKWESQLRRFIEAHG